MFILALALWTTQSTPKTFEDLEIAKAEAVHSIKTFSWAMTASLSVGDQTSTMSMNVLRDGGRLSSLVKMPGDQVFQVVTDGSTTWTGVAPQNIYTEVKVDPKVAFDPKQSIVRCQPNSFNFHFETDAQMGFASDPAPTTQSVESVPDGDSTLRKVIATCKSQSGRVMTITQWFLPDKWILRRFTLDGQSEYGPFHGSGEATLDFKATIPATAFVFDPKDFKKVSQEELRTAAGG